jgi:hypothetical protein
MSLTASRAALFLMVIVSAAGCGSGATGAKNDGAAGAGTGAAGTGTADASAGGAGGGGGVGGGGGAGGDAGASAGAAGQSAGGAGGAGGTSTGGGGAGGGSGSAAGAGGAAGGAAGSAAGAGGAGGGTVTSGTGGGVFVMCDDHADFNGRGLCSPTGKLGAVVATQTLSAGGALTTLTAAFAGAKPATDPGCTQEAAGAACTVVTCPSGAGKNPAGPDAGAITAKSSGGTIVTKPDPTGAYDVAGLAGALWTMPKAALTFTAAGGAIPTFSETFCGPASATITMPAAAPGPALTINRAADLPVQWTGGAVGDVEVSLRDGGAGGASVEVRCFFTGSAGQGTVPKAALAKISAGPHTIASYIWVRKISLPAGTCVELTGVNTNVSAQAGNPPFNGTATFQ